MLQGAPSPSIPIYSPRELGAYMQNAWCLLHVLLCLTRVPLLGAWGAIYFTRDRFDRCGERGHNQCCCSARTGSLHL